MSIINTIKTGLLRGNSYNFPEAGPFSVNALKASKFVDANATKENDDEFSMLGLGQKFLAKIIADPKNGSAVHAFIDPYTAQILTN